MAPKLQTILQLEVPVIVQIGRCRMAMDEILALQPGSILELDKHADEELSLLINNKHIGSGGAVKIGENFGLRISEIGSARQRIAALSGSADDRNALAKDEAQAEQPKQPGETAAANESAEPASTSQES